MSKRVSVMFEVSDEVYDNLVNPFKKSKMLSKLMSTLLTGYLECQEVRDYVDVEIEGMHKASVDVVSNLMQGMQESLAAMGIYTDEAKSLSDQGKSYFKDQQMGAKPSNPNPNVNISNQDLDDLKEQITSMKSSISELVQLIKEGSFAPKHQEDITVAEPDKDIVSEEDRNKASSIISDFLIGGVVDDL